MILNGTIPGYPMVIAANRDEYFDRETEPPVLWDGHPGFVAGRDLKAGGTWLGLNDQGILVGILNRRSDKERDDSALSRGMLCVEALRHTRLQNVKMKMDKSLNGVYNPFNLFYTDGDETYVTYCQEEQKTLTVGPGFHVLANGDMDDTGDQRLKKIFQMSRGIENMGLDEAVKLLQTICRLHTRSKEPLDSVCIHTEKYGTVSSSIVALGSDGRASLFLHAEGSPCNSKYEEVSPVFPKKR
jgi:uncharacterized protein with NRDE domain